MIEKHTYINNLRIRWFLLGKRGEPIYQQWQIELYKFKRAKAPLALPPTKEIVERYMKLNSRKAQIIAQAINPCIFTVFLAAIVLLLIFNNTSSVLWWILTILTAIPFIISATAVLRQAIYEIRVKQHEEDIVTNIYVDNTEGAPGAGKTSSVTNDAKLLADIRWHEICNEYTTLLPFKDNIKYWPQKQKEDAEEIIETYEYYQRSGTYPCLWTTFAVFVDGVPANQFTADHILQRKRIPYGSVIAVDEFNLFVPQNIYRDTPYEIIEISKFCRQWGFSFKIADQATDGTVIYFRRVSGRNRYMLEQQWVLKPRLLIKLFDKILYAKDEPSKRRVNFCKKLQSVIRASGYRKYYYIDSGTAKYKDDTAKVKTFILRSNLNVEYDDRAFKNAYRCKDEPLEISKWEHLRMSTEELSKLYSEELRNRAQSKAKRAKKKQKEVEGANDKEKESRKK